MRRIRHKVQVRKGVFFMLLVTGCSGYVGELLVRRLIHEGVEFRCIDLTNCKNNWTGHTNCDISKISEVQLLSKHYGSFDGVIHLAAIKTVVSTGSQSELWMRGVNQDGTGNIISLLKGNSDSYFIFASSAAVYGDNPRQEIISENYPLKPLSLYGETKLHGENTLRTSFDEGQINKVFCLRFFNISGHQESRFETECVIGGAICHATIAHNLGEDFTVYGTTFNSPDGTSIRDYVHVFDVVESIIKSYRVARESKRNFFESVNVCTGVGTSLLEVIAEINLQGFGELKVNFESTRNGEIGFSIGNPSKASEIMNWQPQIEISPLIGSELRYHKY